jgi:hypothetical protein
MKGRGKVLWLALVALVVVLVAAAAVAHVTYRQRMAEAERAWATIADAAAPAAATYDPAMVAELPEVAQRYFTHAIAPGTPLATTVEFAMEGLFLLGDKDQAQQYRMRARQILAPPHSFVWLAEMTSGPAAHLRLRRSAGRRRLDPLLDVRDHPAGAGRRRRRPESRSRRAAGARGDLGPRQPAAAERRPVGADRRRHGTDHLR